MYAKLYQGFLNGAGSGDEVTAEVHAEDTSGSKKPEKLHFASHSHHYWPDATRDAHTEAWDDAARFADHKWGARIFGQEIPKAQGHIQRLWG